MTIFNTVSLEPIDPLLFGDGRPTRAGTDHLILDQDPTPLSFFGCVGQYLVDCLGPPWPDHVLGPRVPDVLQPPPHQRSAELMGYCFRHETGEPWFSKPLHYRCRAAGPNRPLFSHDLLKPEPPSRATLRSSNPFAMLLGGEPVDDEFEGEVAVRSDVLKQILLGYDPPRVSLMASAVRLSDVFRSEVRAGIGIDNRTGTAEEGILFTRPYRRFRPASSDPGVNALSWGFTLWMATLDDVPAPNRRGTAFLGGDRRRVRLSFEDERPTMPLQDMRDGVAAAVADTRGFFAYLLTPMVASGSLPAIDGRQPIAAAVGKTQFASGWDTHAASPRPMRALVPAGSVFFYEWDERPDQTLIHRHWLTSLSSVGARAGYGRILLGVWR